MKQAKDKPLTPSKCIFASTTSQDHAKEKICITACKRNFSQPQHGIRSTKENSTG
jgi:hypothetical protein